MISAGGRLFTIEDTASAEHPALPGKFALVARDAYNGIVLWRVAFPDWHPIYIRDKETPVQLQRRLATSGQLVYCTPGYFAPITAFDAVTGQPRKTYNGTERTVEFVLDQNTLFVVTGDQSDVSAALMDQARTALKTSLFPLAAYGPRILRAENPKNDILAVDVATGKELWRKTGDDTLGYQGASLAVKNNCIVYATNRDLVCLERATGRLLWRRVAPVVLKGPHGIAVSLVLSEHAAFLADSQSLRAFRLADGSALWSRPIALNHHKPPDVFLANGLVWTASYDASIGRPVPERGLDKLGINGFDPDTGKLLKHIPQTMSGPMGHDRCYRNRITTRFYINSVTGGSDFLEFATSAEFPNPWVRSTCGIGPLPCNGLYYVGPPACACCNSVMLNGLNALAPDPTLRTSGQIPVVEELHHLEKGPAFGATAYPAKSATTEDWPTYRHDPERTGTTKATVPATLTKSWEAKIGRRASAPVIAAGMVYIADVDGHTVYALALKDGKPHWQFTADGRVDSPPTYHDGLLLFGTRSGSVYCLRATDGALLWRFVPLAQRFICAYEQLESAWPICGSILVKNNRAYFAAGRNSFLDGGIFVYAVDPLTGKLLCRHRIYGPYGENGFPIENRHVVGGTSIEGCKGDIFLAAGDKLFLRHQGFNEDLSPIRLQDVKQPHLITSHGFLEAIPHHRSFWTIDTALRYDIPTGLGGIHGDILVTDGNRFFEVRGYQPGRAVAFDPREAGYTLFAGTCAGTATVEQPVRPKRKAKRAAVTPTPRSTKLWSISIPTTGKALVLAGDTLFVAGTPVVFPEDDLAKAYEGRMGGVLWVGSAATGTKLAEYKLDAPPAWDGMAAAHGKLFVTLADGRLLCMEPR
ncbi:MAG: PQQ-binding-like beta-propeller repeat protein [Verrucomicrobiae bacterium]|nr:PQQ-binding-like beta-propeller repeat protein [Verrucomicrobiae bacterium]